MKRIVVILLALAALIACRPDLKPVASGCFALQGSDYPIKQLRSDFVGYHTADSSEFVLRLTAYPATMQVDTSSIKGYGTAIRLYMLADDADLSPGADLRFCSDSLSLIIVIAESGDTTAMIPVTAASVTVSRPDDNGFMTYTFVLETAEGPVEGSFTGNHIMNSTADMPSFGRLAFDTINLRLQRGSLYNWGHLLSDRLYYYELMFFSTDARFGDDGKIRSGLQFALGINSEDPDFPFGGSYTVADSAEPNTLFYGHRMGNVGWGSYWQMWRASSVVGKANILEGTMEVTRLNDEHLECTFLFTDQLGQEVRGNYAGPIAR